MIHSEITTRKKMRIDVLVASNFVSKLANMLMKKIVSFVRSRFDSI